MSDDKCRPAGSTSAAPDDDPDGLQGVACPFRQGPAWPAPLDASTIRAASASQFLSVMSLSNRSNRRVGSAVAHVASLCCISLIIKGLRLIGSDRVHSKQLELLPLRHVTGFPGPRL